MAECLDLTTAAVNSALQRARATLDARRTNAPAFAQYRQNGAEPWSLIVLDLVGDRIGTMHYFLDTETLFPRCGFPMRLDR